MTSHPLRNVYNTARVRAYLDSAARAGEENGADPSPLARAEYALMTAREYFNRVDDKKVPVRSLVRTCAESALSWLRKARGSTQDADMPSNWGVALTEARRSIQRGVARAGMSASEAAMKETAVAFEAALLLIRNAREAE